MADLTELRARALASLQSKRATPTGSAVGTPASTRASSPETNRQQLDECLTIARQLQAKGLRLQDLIKAGVHASFAKDVFTLLSPAVAPPTATKGKRAHEEAFPPLPNGKAAAPAVAVAGTAAAERRVKIVPQPSVVIDLHSDVSSDEEEDEREPVRQKLKQGDSASKLRKMEVEIARAMKAINAAQQVQDRRKQAAQDSVVVPATILAQQQQQPPSTIVDAQLVTIRSEIKVLEGAAVQLEKQLADNSTLQAALTAEMAQLKDKLDGASVAALELADQQRQVADLIRQRKEEERVHLTVVARPAVIAAQVNGSSIASSAPQQRDSVAAAREQTNGVPDRQPVRQAVPSQATSAIIPDAVKAASTSASSQLTTPTVTLARQDPIDRPAASVAKTTEAVSQAPLAINLPAPATEPRPIVSSTYLSPLRCLSSFKFSNSFMTTYSSFRSHSFFHKINAAEVFCTNDLGGINDNNNDESPCTCGRQHFRDILMTGAAPLSLLPFLDSLCSASLRRQTCKRVTIVLTRHSFHLYRRRDPGVARTVRKQVQARQLTRSSPRFEGIGRCRL